MKTILIAAAALAGGCFALPASAAPVPGNAGIAAPQEQPALQQAHSRGRGWHRGWKRGHHYGWRHRHRHHRM